MEQMPWAATMTGSSQGVEGRRTRPVEVCAVVPCFNRHADLAVLLEDLHRLELAANGQRVSLHVIVIDNASVPPISTPPTTAFGLEVVHLSENTGGSGGFSEGIRRAAARGPDFVWLVDSDARVAPGALVELLRVLREEPSVVAAGSALIDKHSGRVYEVGGVVDRRDGSLYPAREGACAGEAIVECDYLAACSALVRTGAVVATGVFPDTFLNGDDAAWFLAMKRATGGRVVGVPASRVTHPDTREFRTWGRYFQSRNGVVPALAAGLGRGAILRRQLHEGAAAVGQACVGRRDLAELHVLGLRDAARGRLSGAAPMAGAPTIPRQRPLSELEAELGKLEPGSVVSVHDELEKAEPALGRILAEGEANGLVVKRFGAGDSRAAAAVEAIGRIGGREAQLAIVPARAHPECWFRAESTATVANGAFTLGTTAPSSVLCGAASVGLRGAWHAAIAAARLPKCPPCAPVFGDRAPGMTCRVGAGDGTGTFERTCEVSAVVLCFNRRGAVERTLRELGDALPHASQIIVVDNASNDGTAAMVRDKYPDCELVALAENSGVAGFNRGVERATGEFVLILDDDSWPDRASLEDALRVLRANKRLGAATMLPRHPDTRLAEWPEAERVSSALVPDWPIMGCGNLVRTELWRRAGGYDEAFFLYRNDWDLALKLRAMGFGTAFDPRWTVWHDSPAAAVKGVRWFHLAVRNWVWLARRHGKGWQKYAGPTLAFARALQIARGEPRRTWNAVRGFAEGWLSKRPELPAGVAGTAHGFARLLEVKMRDHFPRESTAADAGT